MYTLLYSKRITNKDLLFSTWNSTQSYVPEWVEVGFGGEWIHVRVRLSPFTVHLTLPQHCESAVCQYTNLKFGGKKQPFPESYQGFWVFWILGAHTPFLAPCNKHCTFLHHNLVSVNWFCWQVDLRSAWKESEVEWCKFRTGFDIVFSKAFCH